MCENDTGKTVTLYVNFKKKIIYNLYLLMEKDRGGERIRLKKFHRVKTYKHYF